METVVCETHSPDETIALGRSLGCEPIGGLMIGLVGPLGAGKTQLVKGMALGNGASDSRAVTSPTFTLIQEYPGRLTLYHIDVYRLRGPDELAALGLDELVRSDSVVVIEWADRVRELLGPPFLLVDIEPIGPRSRRFTFTAEGQAAVECAAALRHASR